MGVTVRPLPPQEWPVLRQLRLQALADAPYAFGSTFAEEADFDDGRWAAMGERLTWFVAWARDDPVGLVAGMPAGDDPCARDVISMWVAPAHRGSGCAGDLFGALERWARQDGASALVLRVSDRNPRAQRFYEGLGFALTGDRQPLRSDPTASAIEMRLPLPRARLRFAPSPVGDLHVGHVRNAVLTWALSRRLHGDYFVRFENTDRAKEVEGARAAIIRDLEWLGLAGDEPPHDQTVLTEPHRRALERLSGHVYDDGAAVRFRTPADGAVDWYDLARGKVSLRNADLQDPVLVRSSGDPTFFLASTVDDVEDSVTHVVRTVAMMPTTAVQIHLWRALGATPPRAGHVPFVVGPGATPLRVGHTAATIAELRRHGISPAAVVAYLASPDVASLKHPPADVVDRVDLRRVSRRPVTFDAGALARLDRRMRRGTPPGTE